MSSYYKKQEHTARKPQGAAAEVLARAASDWARADKVKRKWLEGGRITKENMDSGTGAMERCSPKEWFSSAKKREGVPGVKDWSSPQGKKMGFGKYKDKLVDEVYHTDRHYFRWCVENVNGFDGRPEVKRYL